MKNSSRRGGTKGCAKEEVAGKHGGRAECFDLQNIK